MRRLAALTFPGFELLDLTGPLELLEINNDQIELLVVSETGGAVPSAQGPSLMSDRMLADGHDYDLLLVPGGRGTRREVLNQLLLDWVATASLRAEIVMSVCTGAALLARAGLLDGRRATTNKLNFNWVTKASDRVDWVRKARWVEDGKYWTSSGVSAGMDMALAVLERLQGPDVAKEAAIQAEYDRHTDPAWDPFAEIHGLV